MSADLTQEQEFLMARAEYEVSRMSRKALEKTALRLLKSRLEQKNGIVKTLESHGITFVIEENLGKGKLPEIISEETLRELQLQKDIDDFLDF